MGARQQDKKNRCKEAGSHTARYARQTVGETAEFGVAEYLVMLQLVHAFPTKRRQQTAGKGTPTTNMGAYLQCRTQCKSLVHGSYACRRRDERNHQCLRFDEQRPFSPAAQTSLSWAHKTIHKKYLAIVKESACAHARTPHGYPYWCAGICLCACPCGMVHSFPRTKWP